MHGGAAAQVTPLAFALPGDPATLTGGYLYDRRLCEALRRRGQGVELLRLDASFPFPSTSALAHARTAFAALPDGAPVLVDGLALGAMPGVAMAERERLRIIALVHHPLALESGLDAAIAKHLERSEREALAAARHVIVTSAWTGTLLRERFGVPDSLLSVAQPGTDPAPPARGSAGPGLRLLCVATLIPRKGHELLLHALAPLSHRDDWQLLCIGSPERDPQHARRLLRLVGKHELGERVQFAGEVDPGDMQRHYHEADAFVLPTRLEGYGMALAEAVARGLPVITTAGGAAADTAGPAALLVPPGDGPVVTRAITRAVARLLDEPHLRSSLAAAALRHAATLPTWDTTARLVQRVVQAVAG